MFMAFWDPFQGKTKTNLSPLELSQNSSTIFKTLLFDPLKIGENKFFMKKMFENDFTCRLNVNLLLEGAQEL